MEKVKCGDADEGEEVDADFYSEATLPSEIRGFGRCFTKLIFSYSPPAFLCIENAF